MRANRKRETYYYETNDIIELSKTEIDRRPLREIDTRPLRPASSPWLSSTRKRKLKEDLIEFMLIELVQLVINHFGYAGIVAGGYFFKLAIAASVASYVAFLSATVVGGLVTYFPTMAIDWALEKYTNVSEDLRKISAIALHIGLSPVAGAWILNLALGWNLALVPMVAVSGAGLAIGAMLMLGMAGYRKYSEHAAIKRRLERTEQRPNTTSALRSQGTFKVYDGFHIEPLISISESKRTEDRSSTPRFGGRGYEDY